MTRQNSISKGHLSLFTSSEVFSRADVLLRLFTPLRWWSDKGLLKYVGSLVVLAGRSQDICCLKSDLCNRQLQFK